MLGWHKRDVVRLSSVLVGVCGMEALAFNDTVKLGALAL